MGFFPYHTEASICTDGESQGNEDNVGTTPAGDETRRNYGATAQSAVRTTARNGGTTGVGGKESLQHIDSVVGSIDMSDSQIWIVFSARADESITLHRNVGEALHAISTCSHGHRRETDWACSLCTKKLGENLNRLTLQNAVLGRFARDLLRNGDQNPN